MDMTMGFRTYWEAEEAYNNLESEYLLRENTSLFSEMHNYISENIVELPYCESYFTEASSKNILQKIWDFLVKCWNSIIGVIKGIFNLFKRLVSNSDKILNRLDLIAKKQGVDQKDIDKLDDKSIDAIGLELDEIAKHYQDIDPELTKLFSNAKGNPKKIKAAIGTLLGLGGATAIGTKLLGTVTSGVGKIGAAGKAAGAGWGLFGFPNLSYVLGGHSAAHITAGGSVAGATAIKGAGGAISTSALSSLASGGGTAAAGATTKCTIASTVSGIIDTACAATGVSTAAIASALGIATVGSLGVVAGAEKLINDAGDYEYIDNSSGSMIVMKTSQKWRKEQLQSVLPPLVLEFNIEAAYMYLQALIIELMNLNYIYAGPIDQDPNMINDGFSKYLADIYSKGKATFIDYNALINRTNDNIKSIQDVEKSFKNSVFNKTNIIIWRFLKGHTGDEYKSDAKLIQQSVENATKLSTSGAAIRHQFVNPWSNTKLNDPYDTIDNELIARFRVNIRDFTMLKLIMDGVNAQNKELAKAGINKDNNYRTMMLKDKNFIAINNVILRYISTLANAILSRYTIAASLTNKNTSMNQTLCKDVEKILGFLASLPGAAVGAVKAGVGKIKSKFSSGSGSAGSGSGGTTK